MAAPFLLNKDNVWAVPISHYNMEMAAQVRIAFNQLKPDCVAVELAETMQLQLLHAASRLPDISVVMSYDSDDTPVYYMCEPCEAVFEGLRSALEAQIPAWCIDLDVYKYPNFFEGLPDSYAIQRIGLKEYYNAYKRIILEKGIVKSETDLMRELYMARRLKELSLKYDKVLFVGGMAHIESIFDLMDRNAFPKQEHANRSVVEICTLTELSCRDVMGEYGWISQEYENSRNAHYPDRQQIIYKLLKQASQKYIESTGNPFPGYHMRNLMKYMRNYALICGRLMPNLFQLLSAAKGCVDHNYAYEVWKLATEYNHRRNIDNLAELELTVEDVWGHSKLIHFHMHMKNPKSLFPQNKHKSQRKIQFSPPGPFSICSYPPEDLIIERFGEFLKKKGVQLLTEETTRTIPFSTSLEDGVDTRETIRHWHEKKIFVKSHGKPLGEASSVVMIFDEDISEENSVRQEKFPWCTTWIGEHDQESDMAFYATPLTNNVVGPGISRCEYGGFMMTSPPRRLYNIWSDADYQGCQSKSEILLMAAIDYSVQSLVIYVAAKPPRSVLKSYARHYGKKVVYIPIGQLSPITLNKLRAFHVFDSHDKRTIADEYIT